MRRSEGDKQSSGTEAHIMCGHQAIALAARMQELGLKKKTSQDY